ncbi:RidA family protein [Natronorubrum sp. DTA7]|uniref:RidA family protein n=1 Tax=Natronorubrum sp. DTA7 TaxID=3447016 RepID=UPI003F856E0A
MNDVVRIRTYVQDVMDDEFETIREVRGEFFDREHLPASALLEIGSIVRGNIEIEIEAVVPDSEWEVEHVSAPSS